MTYMVRYRRLLLMIEALRLRRGAALAALIALAAAACDTETIELLAPRATAGSTEAGQPAMLPGGGAAGVPSHGGSSGDPQGGTGASSGSAGSALGEAGSGGDGDCEGCGGVGGGAGGSGGVLGGPNCSGGPGTCSPCQSDEQCGDWHCSQQLGGICVQCTDSSHCKPGSRCDGVVGRCAQSCEGNLTCREGRICDPQFLTCVACIDDEQCEQDGDPQTAYCAGRRCVECTRNDDCTRGSKNLCLGGRCAECFFDKDCGPGGYCAPDGRCE